jgi:hypothetical protein
VRHNLVVQRLSKVIEASVLLTRHLSREVQSQLVEQRQNRSLQGFHLQKKTQAVAGMRGLQE